MGLIIVLLVFYSVTYLDATGGSDIAEYFDYFIRCLCLEYFATNM